MKRGHAYFCDGRHRTWDEEDLADRGELVEAPYFRECAGCGLEINLCLDCRAFVFLCARCFRDQRAYGKEWSRRRGRARERDRRRKRLLRLRMRGADRRGREDGPLEAPDEGRASPLSAGAPEPDLPGFGPELA